MNPGEAGEKFIGLKQAMAILLGTGFAMHCMFRNATKYMYPLVVALALWPASARAQAVAGLGAITGTVRDASGAVVSSAAVTITNASIGFSRRLETTGAGIFAAPSVTPGPGYQIEVEKNRLREMAERSVRGIGRANCGLQGESPGRLFIHQGGSNGGSSPGRKHEGRRYRIRNASADRQSADQWAPRG